MTSAFWTHAITFAHDSSPSFCITVVSLFRVVILQYISFIKKCNPFLRKLLNVLKDCFMGIFPKPLEWLKIVTQMRCKYGSAEEHTSTIQSRLILECR